MTSILGSVSQWILQAQAGDEKALADLHQRFWPILVRCARMRLKGAPLHDVDSEDIAQSAFISFYSSLRAQRFPQLENRDQLLALFSHIIACKAANEIKHAMSKRAGGGAIKNDVALAELFEDPGQRSDYETICKDFYDFYMRRVPPKLKEIARLHLAGFSNAEIAKRVDCVERTIERKLALLRDEWHKLANDSFRVDTRQLMTG